MMSACTSDGAERISAMRVKSSCAIEKCLPGHPRRGGITFVQCVGTDSLVYVLSGNSCFLISLLQVMYTTERPLLRIIFMKRRIYLHENKYFSS